MRKLLIATLAVALLAVLLFAFGVYRVRGGEVGVVGGEVRGEGWHWRWPWEGVERVVVGEAGGEGEVRLVTREGAGVVVRVAGRFGVEAGREAEVARALGGRGVVAVALEVIEAGLQARLAAGGVGALGESGVVEGLERELAARGIAARGLAVELPRGANPAVAAVARQEVAAEVERRGGGRKVVVVGWDAADWQIIRPLVAAGRMPVMKGLMERGVVGSLRAEKPLLSPLIWTTMATGKGVAEHGIADFLVRDPASGGLVPIASTARRVQALWTMLTAVGVRSDVVAWWATWPAERILGTMVTDRLAYQLFKAPGESGAAGVVWPEEAWGWVKPLVVTAEGVTAKEVERFVKVSEGEVEAAWEEGGAEPRQENKLNHLRKIIAATRTYEGVAERLLGSQAACTLVYFESTDTVGHLFGRYMPPQLAAVSAAEVETYGGALEAVYEWMDELLGRVMARVEPGTVVVVVSDHGFYTGSLRPDSDPADFTTGAAEWHRSEGIFVAAGDGIGRADAGVVTAYDIAPTVLALLGVPAGKDMPGKVVTAALPTGTVVRERIASYESLPRVGALQVARSAEADRERMQELAALGYISPGAGEAASTATPSGTALATQLHNLGGSLMTAGKLDEAKAKFEEAVRIQPSYGPSWEALAEIALQQGDPGRAFAALAEGFSRSRTMSAGRLEVMAEAAARSGRLGEADTVLERIRPQWGGKAEYHTALGVLAQRRGRSGEALEEFTRALGIAPAHAGAVAGTIAVLRAQGQEQEARSRLRTALGQAGSSATVTLDLVAVALEQGWGADVEGVLRRFVADDPGHVGARRNLAIALLQQNKLAEAEREMGEVLRRQDDDARAQQTMGIILFQQDRTAEALARFDRAAALGLRSAELQVLRARALYLLGRRAEAETALRDALALHPGDADAARLLAILERERR